MTRDRYFFLRDQSRYLARYGAFLASCVQTAERVATREEVAAAEAVLSRPVDSRQPQLDLRGRAAA